MIYIFASSKTEETGNVTHLQKCGLVTKLLFRKQGHLKSQIYSFHSLYSKQIQVLAQKEVNNQPAIHYSLMMQEAISATRIFKSKCCHEKMHLFQSH